MAKTIGLIVLIILSILLGFIVLTIFNVIPDYIGVDNVIDKIVDVFNGFK